MEKRQAFKIGRRNSDGHLAPVEVARRYPNAYSIEHMPVRGRGDTGRSKKK